MHVHMCLHKHSKYSVTHVIIESFLWNTLHVEEWKYTIRKCVSEVGHEVKNKDNTLGSKEKK